MGTRAVHIGHHLDGDGEPVAGASVYVYDQHTTTPISGTIYLEDSDHPTLSASTQTNPITTATDGSYAIWLAEPAKVDLKIVTPGGLLQDVERTVVVTRTPNTPSLDEIADVDTTGKADGEVLTYDSTTGNWLAEPAASSPLADAAPPAIAAAGSVGVSTDAAREDHTHSGSAYQALSVVDAKGDLYVGTAADTTGRLAVGSEGTVPVSRAAAATGIAWETPASATPVHLNAASMHPTSGTPALGVVASRWVAMLFDGAGAEQAAGSVDIPTGWATVDIVVYWTNAGAGSGGVTWTVLLDSVADAATLASSGTSSSASSTAPAQDVLKVTTVATGVAVTPANLQNIRLLRNAADAGDTLTNDAALIAVELRKAS